MSEVTSSKYFSNKPPSRKCKQEALANLCACPTKKTKKHIKIEYENHDGNPKSVKNEEKPLLNIKTETVSPIKIMQDIKTELQTPKKEETLELRSSEIKVENDWRPKNWDILYHNIKEMRKDRTAIVDSQGCERTADPKSSPKVSRYQILISLMLSSQTKDPVTFETMERLKKHGLTVPNIVRTSDENLGTLINKVGFWKKKTVYIKQATLICHEQYDNDIPDTLDGLLALPGVGPKMAHICMNAAWNKITGIGVDTHVHRISNWLHFVKKPTKNPEQTRKELESWLPVSEWHDFNILLVGFGQQTCLPIRPKCDICLNRPICPATSQKFSPLKKKIKKEIKNEEDV